MRKRTYLAAVLALALGAGCQSKATYDGAVYANALPMYGKATYENSMGGTTYGDDGSESKSMSWFFEFTEPKEKVIAYYEKALPHATRSIAEDGDVQFTVVPEGAKEGEKMMVIISDNGIQIHEELAAR